jgi:hypothetical protein
MNDRIRLLAEQASEIDGDDLLYYNPVFAEKFAESIVRECMEMCANVSADYLKHRKAAYDFQDKNIYAEGEAACDILKYKMKKHFGVEE